MDNPPFQERLKLLRQNYLQQLPDKVRQIRQAWDLRKQGNAAANLAEMRRLVHNLSGSGATFGCQDIGAVAERLEELLRDVLGQTEPLSSQAVARIETELQALDAGLQHCFFKPAQGGNAVPQPPAEHIAPSLSTTRRLLYLVDDDKEFAAQFIERLASHGYEVRVFEGFEALHAAFESATPLALVMDMVLPGSELGGAEFVRRLYEKAGKIVPAIFLSLRDDFGSRLAAVRAGATHYLPKPLDVPRLVRILEDYFGCDQANPYRVLVVDDDAPLADMYRMYMEEAGLSVSVVNDPLAAMAQMQQFAPDLVLMDINMPVCNGLELAAVIRQHEQYDQVPIVFLSTDGHADRKLVAMNLGGDEFLTKPVLPWHLVSAVMARIKRARALRHGALEIQHALHELEFFRQAMNQHAIVSMSDTNGNITYVNDKFCEVSGYARSELIGQSHRIVKSGAHPQAFYDGMWTTIASGRVWQGEVRNRKKSGETYWVETTIVPFLDDFGVPQRYISVRTDITRIKQIEEALRASDERLRLSQNYANIGTWDWNIQTGELYWSERIGPLFGYEEGKLETTYENFLNAVHPEDRQAVIEAVNAAVERDARYDIEHRCVWPDGSVRWLLERGAVVRAPDGKPLHMLGVVQDVTERRLAQQSLQESEQRLREAQQIARLGNWSWDVASGRLTWSDEIFHIFGRQPGDFEPSYERFFEVVHPDDVEQIKRSEQEAFAKGEKHSVDHRIILPDGEVRWVHEEAVTTLDATGQPASMAGTVQDITARKQVEAELLAARNEADRANRAKSDFLASMSHELRTPMNAILGFAQLLESDPADPLSPAQKEGVDHILHAGWHLLELINEVLDLAKVESGRIDLSIESVDPVELITECADLISAVSVSRQVSVVNRVTQPGQYLVRADRTRLKQALLNLLSNAVKYNRDHGQVTISARQEEAGRLRICVSDTGIGLSEQQQQNLFQPFNRLGAELGEQEGTGIGLVITRRIIELMDGLVGVESRVGEGSTFWIELDSLEGIAAAQAEHADSADMAEPGWIDAQRTVLYVEDNPANLRLVAHMLARRPNVKLLSAHTGDLGLGLARSKLPDLIIMDVNLPGMDGFEVCARLRMFPETREIPVIALSANAMPRDVEKGLAAGFVRYLAKPVKVDELMQSIDDFLFHGGRSNEKGNPV